MPEGMAGSAGDAGNDASSRAEGGVLIVSTPGLGMGRSRVRLNQTFNSLPTMFLDEPEAGDRRPEGVRTGRPETDLEDVERTDRHAGRPRSLIEPASPVFADDSGAFGRGEGEMLTSRA